MNRFNLIFRCVVVIKLTSYYMDLAHHFETARNHALTKTSPYHSAFAPYPTKNPERDSKTAPIQVGNSKTSYVLAVLTAQSKVTTTKKQVPSFSKSETILTTQKHDTLNVSAEKFNAYY